MPDMAMGDLSNTLFNVAFITYLIAMVLAFARLAFTRVGASGTPLATRRAGLWAGRGATALALGGAAVHLGSIVTRGLAAGHVPWSNMYEYSSFLAFGTVVVGLVVVQQRLGYGHLMGFVLALAILSMTSALLLFTEPTPLVPSLQSWWINVHTSAAMGASTIFIIGFMATALYLVKRTAERRVGISGAGATTARPAGADTVAGGEASSLDEESRGEGFDDFVTDSDDAHDPATDPQAQRDALSPVTFPGLPFLIVSLYAFWVWGSVVVALLAGSVAALLGISLWYAVPKLPPSDKLDQLAYRMTAFAFPIWTFAIIAGALWAQEAWGRYWGWDPKETGSFFTWVLYAGYLHARSTRGWRGVRAAWLGVAAFIALAVTYYAVNLFVVGLHSYAGV